MRLTDWVILAALVAAVGGCAPQALPPIQSVEIGPSAELRVNGKPFFPLMNFYQSPESFKNAAAMGLNSYFYPGAKPPPKEYLDALQAKGLYGIVPFDEAAAGHPALLAWLQPHEPEAAFLKGKAEMSPQKMRQAYEKMKQAKPSRPVVLDFSPQFASIPEVGGDELSAERKKDLYPAYARAADIVTYNVYPIWNYNKPECLTWVGQAADDLKALLGVQKPFMAMIETGKGSRTITEAQQQDVSVDQTRAEVWTAICHGARGIIYFTHQFKPKFTEFGPDAAKQTGIRKINEEITRLAPILLSPAAKREVAVELFNLHTHGGSGRIVARDTSCTAREKDGWLWIFVVNAGAYGGWLLEVHVAGLEKSSRVEVPGERRTLKADEGEFYDDNFGPYELRAYKIKL